MDDHRADLVDVADMIDAVVDVADVVLVDGITSG